MATVETDEPTFVETALKLGGKSDEEARTTGAVDRAEDQVEAMYLAAQRTSGGPVHRAVWDDKFPAELFSTQRVSPGSEVRKVMDASLEVVRRRKKAGTLLNSEGKVSDESLAELSRAGYWRLLVDVEYGGAGSKFAPFSRFLTEMATVDATVAGMASVHGCIGAVDPLRTFGTREQKAAFLPTLASGERLSAFALTEPGAGSDLTALRTVAVLDGDDYVVNGEKLFITNAGCGRTVGLVCRIDDKPAVLIADLPEKENEHFQIVQYKLYALKQCYNHGMKFRDFRVPKANLLIPEKGDGLAIAYHGLNHGRVALCAGAAGSMRVMLASMLPWARYRRTYGAAIDTRELIQRRIGRLAALIVGCDALTEWCGSLLDAGFRGELECIIAKVFGSESQKEAAIELLMKTHGGRAFLHGHLFGDNVHEYLAPCIYEGEGEILGMGFFKSLVKDHGKNYYEPIGKALYKAGIKQPNLLNPAHVWKLRNAVVPYAKWRAGQLFGGASRPSLPTLKGQLSNHAEFAAVGLQRSRSGIDALMQKYQLKLADRQCAVAAESKRVQSLVVMLVSAMWAGQQSDTVLHAAADVLCCDLRREITGEKPTGNYFRNVTSLGKTVADGGFSALAGVDADEILMPYEQ
ncbi:MAG: acyl-CoA dehydrogenase family protein [Planctomycetaceae bacterium]